VWKTTASTHFFEISGKIFCQFFQSGHFFPSISGRAVHLRKDTTALKAKVAAARSTPDQRWRGCGGEDFGAKNIRSVFDTKVDYKLVKKV
jgi:hypothetical protein